MKTTPNKKTLLHLGKPIVFWIGFLLVIELVVRSLHEFGGLTDETRFRDDLYIRNHQLVYELTPNQNTDFKYRRSFMHVPVQVNAFGYRDDAMRLPKPNGSFRIATMGDSITFGWEVLEQNTYPRQLEKILNEEYPDALGNIEVLNFGVPGYTTFSGKKILKDRVMQFKPDLLVIGYGFNDWKYNLHSMEEKLAKDNLQIRSLQFGIKKWLVKTHQLLRKSKAFAVIDHRIQAKNLSLSHPENYASYKHAVNPEQYYQNIKEMILLAQKQGTSVILLNSNFLNDYTLPILNELSQEFKVPLLDLRQRFEEDDQQLEQNTERWMGLQTAHQPQQQKNAQPDSRMPILFRVYVPENMRREVEKKGLFLYGNHPDLGNWEVGSIALNDGGNAGDQVAQDGVWSIEVPMNFSSINKQENRFSPETLEYSFLPVGPDVVRVDSEAMAIYRNFVYYYHIPLKGLKEVSNFRTPVHILDYCPYSQNLLAGLDRVHTNGAGNKVIAQMIQKTITQKNLIRF